MTDKPKITPLTENRLGQFSIARAYILSPECFGFIQYLFGQVIVIRAEMMFASDSVQYIGYSPEFDILPDGVEIPIYDLSLEQEKTDDDKLAITNIEFKRRV